MAHFAKIGMNGKVINVLTLADNDMLDANDQPQERVGQQYLEKHHSWPADMWVQTSYNTFENKHSSGDNSSKFLILPLAIRADSINTFLLLSISSPDK